MILLIVTICGGMLLLPLVLIGGSINFGIGPLFKFGIKGRRKSCERQERIDRIHEVSGSFRLHISFSLYLNFKNNT